MTAILKNQTTVNADGFMEISIVTDDPVPVELQDSAPIVTEHFTYDSVQLNTDGTHTENPAPEIKPVAEEVQLSQSLLQLPEIQLLVGFYNTEIQKIKSDRTQQPYLKKLKLKRLQNEYRQVVLWIQGVSKLMVQLETDPDNVQTQADINVIGKLFAERITKLVLSHGLGKVSGK